MLNSFGKGKTDFVVFCDFCNKELKGSPNERNSDIISKQVYTSNGR